MCMTRSILEKNSFAVWWDFTDLKKWDKTNRLSVCKEYPENVLFLIHINGSWFCLVCHVHFVQPVSCCLSMHLFCQGKKLIQMKSYTKSHKIKVLSGLYHVSTHPKAHESELKEFLKYSCKMSGWYNFVHQACSCYGKELCHWKWNFIVYSKLGFC